jgi:hypothetical protein
LLPLEYRLLITRRARFHHDHRIENFVG